MKHEKSRALGNQRAALWCLKKKFFVYWLFGIISRFLTAFLRKLSVAYLR